MTESNKDLTRALSRAETLRVAIVDSGLAREWAPSDLENMADAASMVWDQANALAIKHPEAKPQLAESIARIFEPLLSWSGRFDLCAKLARTRCAHPSHAVPSWNATLARFEALAFQGRFQDLFAWDRQESFARAQITYAELVPHLAELSAVDCGRIAHAWFLIGLEDLAKTLIADHVAADILSYYESHPAPAAWRAAHISTAWLRLLRNVRPRVAD